MSGPDPTAIQPPAGGAVGPEDRPGAVSQPVPSAVRTGECGQCRAVPVRAAQRRDEPESKSVTRAECVAFEQRGSAVTEPHTLLRVTRAIHDVDCDQGPSCEEVLTTDGRYGRYAQVALTAIRQPHHSDTDHLTVSTSDRGLVSLPPIPSACGGSVRVYESSAAAGPHIWLAANSPIAPYGTVHLSMDDALKLADQIRLLAANHYQGSVS